MKIRILPWLSNSIPMGKLFYQMTYIYIFYSCGLDIVDYIRVMIWPLKTNIVSLLTGHGSNLTLNLFEPQNYVFEFVSDADNNRTAQASGVIYTTKY